MIGILYLCTGRYVKFWKDFFISSEQYFLPNEEKIYFVFTDANEIFAEKNFNVKKIYQKHMKWPFSTLMRYEIFSKLESRLRNCKYIFSINASTVFVDSVGYHVYPAKENNGLVATIHPALWKINAKYVPYERKSASEAYIPQGQGLYYFMSAFYGGETEVFLQLVAELKLKIDTDLSSGFIAAGNDESYLNKYLLDKNPKALHSGYSYPEGWTIPFPPKLIILNKLNYGGVEYLREVPA